MISLEERMLTLGDEKDFDESGVFSTERGIQGLKPKQAPVSLGRSTQG